MDEFYLGIDVGSTTVKVVVLTQECTLLAHRYLRSKGQPRQTLLQAMEELSQHIDLSRVTGVGLTGSGGEPIARLIGGHHVNELIAQTRAVGALYPQARTVIEIGGQDSKLLSVEWDTQSGKMVLVDFSMNALCAAGTGSFLDQQAERLDIAIEDEFAALAVQSQNPARIAGRCTVFAKSDMIHLQQKGTPLSDILAGLCMALARNFKSVIGKGKSFTPPILFQGGVAYNAGVVRAFESVLQLPPGELIVPEHHQLMAALGTALVARDEASQGLLPTFCGFEPLREYVISGKTERKSMPKLMLTSSSISQKNEPINPEYAKQAAERLPVYMGVDVGSISTNVVLIDEYAQVVARRYLHTAGKPLEAVRRALNEIDAEVGQHVEVCGVGTTGSGRYLTADFVGGDVVRSEITAQARAAVAIDPAVDTVFEIGGQDSKYIALNHGAVVDFAMNSACAAGTGSFLEEQADRLQIDIKEDFSQMALASSSPTCLGERCTVFMESDIVHHQQQGAKVDELTAGLAYAIVQNYLNRVLDGRQIGKNVFFQGGVAWNKSVVAAFETLTKRKVTVPPHHDVTGAIGVAILALEEMTCKGQDGSVKATKFKGFDLNNRQYHSTVFECKACPNLCEVNKVVIGGEKPFFYGARCDKFEDAGRSRTVATRTIPDLFAERHDFLMGDYMPPTGPRNGRLRVAIPRSLIFYDLFPFWRTFFQALDIEIVLSEATNPNIVRHTVEYATAETCFPAKLAYGHVVDLLDKDADFIFLPSVINRENTSVGQEENNYCPYIPAMSHLVAANVDIHSHGPRPLLFPLHMSWNKVKQKQLQQLSNQLRVSRKQIARANDLAEVAQRDFYATIRRRGREVLAQLTNDQPTIVIVGRPYNVCDLSVCQDLPFKLSKMGILPIPMDYLPLETVDLTTRHNNMYWRSGQDILAAAHIIRDIPDLHAVYMTSFNCGPDSFLLSFFRNIMGDKPFLELEMDEHTADAGVVTRCEAFFESLTMGKGVLV